jgi:hypothetical protein
MITAIQEIENKVNKAAEQIGINDLGFNNLSLKDRCFGLAVFAQAAGETEIKAQFMEMYNFLN